MLDICISALVPAADSMGDAAVDSTQLNLTYTRVFSGKLNAPLTQEDLSLSGLFLQQLVTAVTVATSTL